MTAILVTDLRAGDYYTRRMPLGAVEHHHVTGVYAAEQTGYVELFTLCSMQRADGTYVRNGELETCTQYLLSGATFNDVRE